MWRAAPAWIVLVGARAIAAPSPVVLPRGPFVADGARSYALEVYLVDGESAAPVPDRVEVRAARGQIVEPPERAPDGGLRLRWRPPRVEAPSVEQLTVGGKVVALSLEPGGASRIAIAVSPDPLVLAPRGGARETAEVKLEVRDAAGRPVRAALRLGVSVGEISPPVETAPGDYRATFRAPEARFPQVALIVASSPADGAWAVARLPLAARVTVEGTAEPGSSMIVLVDGKPFGPRPVAPDGKFALPVEVPPGARAVGLSTDRLGNERRRPIDLGLPPFPHLVLAAAPDALRADGAARAEVIAAAIDERGRPRAGAAPRLTADAGWLSPPEPRGDGVWAFSLAAPVGVGKGAIRVQAPAERAQIQVALRPGPPRTIAIVQPAEALAAGLDEPQGVEVKLADAAGSPIAGARIEASIAGGRVHEVLDRGDGRYRIALIPPADPGRGRATLRVRASGGSPGPPRRISLHTIAGPVGQIAVEAWVDDDLGRPVAGLEVTIETPGGERRAVTDGFGTARVEFPRPHEHRFRVSAGATPLGSARGSLDLIALADGRLLAGPDEGAAGAPAEASAEAEIALRPALPVDLRIRAEPHVVKPGGEARVRIEALAGALPTGKLVTEPCGGRLEVIRRGAGGAIELRFTAPARAPPGGRCVLSVTDPVTRVTAFTEIEVRP